MYVNDNWKNFFPAVFLDTLGIHKYIITALYCYIIMLYIVFLNCVVISNTHTNLKGLNAYLKIFLHQSRNASRTAIL